MKVFDMGLHSTFCEWIPLRILPSSFKRFFHCGSKVLGVVQSTNVLCWSEQSRAGFPPALSKVPGDQKLKKTAYAWSYFTHCATRACTFNSCLIARDIWRFCLVKVSKTPLTQTWKITVQQMRILFIFFTLSINYRTIHYKIILSRRGAHLGRLILCPFSKIVYYDSKKHWLILGSLGFVQKDSITRRSDNTLQVW